MLGNLNEAQGDVKCFMGQLPHKTCTMNISAGGESLNSMSNQDADIIRTPGWVYSIQTKRHQLKERTL